MTNRNDDAWVKDARVQEALAALRDAVYAVHGGPRHLDTVLVLDEDAVPLGALISPASPMEQWREFASEEERREVYDLVRRWRQP